MGWGTPGRERALGQAAPRACWGLGLVLGRELGAYMPVSCHTAQSPLCPASLPLWGASLPPSSLSGQGGHSTGLEVNELQSLGEVVRVFAPDAQGVTSGRSAVNYLHPYLVSNHTPPVWVASPKASGLSPGEIVTKCNLQQQ